MDLRAFVRVAGMFVSLGTCSCANEVQPGGLTADASSSGAPSTGEIPEPDEPGPTTSGSTSGAVDPGTTGAPTSSTTGTTGDGPFCGDGVVDPGEQCDLGRDNSNVGPCTLQCLDATCGDGLLWAGVEQCDDGESNSFDYGGCRPDDCTWGPRCGDGEVDPGHAEECDFAELNGTGETVEGAAACSATCRWVGRLVFLSSETYTGALGGVSGADLKCQVLAQAAGLTNPSKYRAWISDGIQSPISRFDQLALDGVPYILRNGRILAANFTELVEMGPRTGISLTESATAIVEKPVWTNTSAFGEPFSATNHCAEWTAGSKSFSARVGLNAVEVEQGPDWIVWRSERQWTSFINFWCSEHAHLYCFEDGAA